MTGFVRLKDRIYIGLPRDLRHFAASRRHAFKRIGTDAAEMGMATGAIVEDLDVVKDIGATPTAGFVDTFADAFFLQAAEERLGDGVVPAVATPAHARLQMVRT